MLAVFCRNILYCCNSECCLEERYDFDQIWKKCGTYALGHDFQQLVIFINTIIERWIGMIKKNMILKMKQCVQFNRGWLVCKECNAKDINIKLRKKPIYGIISTSSSNFRLGTTSSTRRYQ